MMNDISDYSLEQYCGDEGEGSTSNGYHESCSSSNQSLELHDTVQGEPPAAARRQVPSAPRIDEHDDACVNHLVTSTTTTRGTSITAAPAPGRRLRANTAPNFLPNGSGLTYTGPNWIEQTHRAETLRSHSTSEDDDACGPHQRHVHEAASNYYNQPKQPNSQEQAMNRLFPSADNYHESHGPGQPTHHRYHSQQHPTEPGESNVNQALHHRRIRSHSYMPRGNSGDMWSSQNYNHNHNEPTNTRPRGGHAPATRVQETRMHRIRTPSMDGSCTANVPGAMSMDGSSYSVDSFYTCPGASFSTMDSADGARPRVVQPGVSWERTTTTTVEENHMATKERERLARMHHILRTVDENTNVRSSAEAPNVNMTGGQDHYPEDRYRAKLRNNNVGAGTVHHVAQLEDRYRSKASQGNPIPGTVVHEGLRSSDAANAKLDQHFGPTLERMQQQANDNYRHVSLLNPRRDQSHGAELVLDVSEPEQFDTEPVEDGGVHTSSLQQRRGSSREHALEEGVVRRRTLSASSSWAKKEGSTRWFSAPTWVCFMLLIVFALLGAIITLVVVQSNNNKSSPGEHASDSPSAIGQFEGSLHAKTLALLNAKDPDSPQYKAYQWLQSDGLFLTYPLWRKQQRFALATLFFALYQGNDGLEKDFPWFQSDSNECDWVWDSDEPPVCDATGRYVILSLRLDHHDLQDVPADTVRGVSNNCFGSSNCTVSEIVPTPRLAVPGEIGLLKIEQLTITHISTRANISQLWPHELFALPGLVKLAIRESPGLTGMIPTELGIASSLEVLSIESSSVSGVIPTEVSQLQHLQELTIIENPSLSGSLPTELGLLSGLRLMWIFDNHNMTGPIPTEFGLLTSLAFFSVVELQLTGTIPSELGLISDLNEFRVGRNGLSGTIPSELGALTNLRTFDVDQNDRLSGTMPVFFCSGVKYFVDCSKVVCCNQ